MNKTDKNCLLTNLFYKKVTFLVLLNLFFIFTPLHQSSALPVFKDDKTHQWVDLEKEAIKEDILYHKKRVVFLTSLIAGYIRANKTLSHQIASTHDSRKLQPFMLDKITGIYRSTISNPKEHPTIVELNLADKADELNILKREGAFDGQAITPEGLKASFAVDLADKFDRYLYPRALARQVFKKRSETVISPEMSRVLDPLSEYLDLKRYAEEHNFSDIARLKTLIGFVERNYYKWMSSQKLIPHHLYKPSCQKIF